MNERIAKTPLAVVQHRWNIRVVVAADKYTVATISQGMNDREEYGRLFAAAPNMLAALHKAHDYLDSHGNGWEEAETLAAIREAMEKAEGAS